MKSLKHILSNCPHPLPTCHIERVWALHQQLVEGKPFTSLRGTRLKQNPQLIRFKISRDLRLIYRDVGQCLEPHCLISRQGFERMVKRR